MPRSKNDQLSIKAAAGIFATARKPQPNRTRRSQSIETRVEDEREDDDINTSEQDGSSWAVVTGPQFEDGGPALPEPDHRWVLSTSKDVAQDPHFRSVAQLTRVDDSLIDSLKQIKDSVEVVILRADESEIIDELERLVFENDGSSRRAGFKAFGSKVARDHGISPTERAASGQKLGLRVTLANTNEQLEALILLSYMRQVDGVAAEKLADMFVCSAKGVFGCGLLKKFTLSRSVPDVPLIENGDFTLLCNKRTLEELVSKIREISLLKARLCSRPRRITLDLKSPCVAAPPAKCKSARNRKTNQAKAASKRRSMAR
ncbi:hypothetical protein HDU90_003551 [Geranomyces variabilis]|nr:hypothetical protein HDU90_003551 [Geranomyces variabilis]